MNSIVCTNCGYTMISCHEQAIEPRLGSAACNESSACVEVHGDLQVGVLDQETMLGFAPCQRCGQLQVFDLDWMTDRSASARVYAWST